MSEQGRSAAGDAVEQVQQTAGHIVSQAKEMTGAMTERAIERAGSEAVRRAVSLLAPQKDETAVVLTAAAQALRQTGRELRGQDEEAAAQSAEQAAEHLTRFAAYLRQHEVQDILTDAERVAARIPAVTMSGAMIAGLLGARLLAPIVADVEGDTSQSEPHS